MFDRKADKYITRESYRHVTIDKEWKSYDAFKRDMRDEYDKHVAEYGEKNTQLDRLDPNKGYTKRNCRWATIKEQARNKRNTIFLDLHGKKQSMADVAEQYKINPATLRARIKVFGYSVEEAVSKPLRGTGDNSLA